MSDNRLACCCHQSSRGRPVPCREARNTVSRSRRRYYTRAIVTRDVHSHAKLRAAMLAASPSADAHASPSVHGQRGRIRQDGSPQDGRARNRAWTYRAPPRAPSRRTRMFLITTFLCWSILRFRNASSAPTASQTNQLLLIDTRDPRSHLIAHPARRRLSIIETQRHDDSHTPMKL